MTSQLTLINGIVYTPRGIIERGAIEIIDNKVSAIYEQGIKSPKLSGKTINVDGAFVCPGFIDIHNNGGGGALIMDGTQESIEKIAQAHARHGTTAFLPTTVAWSDEEQVLSIQAIVKAIKTGTGGSRILGVHMEGPFLNPAKGGAHNPKYLYEPSPEKFDQFFNAAEGQLKLITLSPELPNAIQLIKYARQKGVVVSAGHTTANYEQAIAAIDAGVQLCAHIMNAMPPIAGRDPGLATAMLISPKTMVELITDGYHVHPALVKLIVRVKGIDSVILVTDSTPPSGTDIKSWTLEGATVTIKGFTGFLPDGTIAGSALTMGSAVKIAKQIIGLPLENILPMASSNAAKLLGIYDQTGSLEVGKAADVVVLSNDGQLNTLLTLVEGQVVFQSSQLS